MIGFEDETWWSRFEKPRLSSWSPQQKPLRLVEQYPDPKDKTPKALSCYGLLLDSPADRRWKKQVWLRFVEERPVSALSVDFLAFVSKRLARKGKRVLVLFWDNASWHISRAVKDAIRRHNQTVKRSGKGVRILLCFLPVKSPWLNRMEPHWVHAKKNIVEPETGLSAIQIETRVCQYFHCHRLPHLATSKYVA